MKNSEENAFPILLAEDNPVSRRLLEKNLTKAGHEVVSVTNGREALEVLKQTFFPMVITDWMMPEMDGLALCRAIRGQATPGYVFIVFLTAKDSQDDIIAGLEAGADEYLTKPFSHAELMARLKTGKRILQLERSLKKANEEIRILSVMDPLTKSFNRGHVMSRLPEEIRRAGRYGHQLSVILCDVDYFKGVNDQHGHLAGDSVLKAVVECIRQTLRDEIDWVARYGGEEFLVILPETGFAGAMVVAERLRCAIAEKTVHRDGKDIRVTASFGVACFDPAFQAEPSPEALLKQADTSLYEAKSSGRNAVRGNEYKARYRRVV